MLNLVTDASIEPVTLSEMKTFMKVDLTDEESLIEALIISARLSIENYCGIGLITKTYDYIFDDVADVIKIPLPPLQSVDTFVYNDEDYDETEISSSYYKVFSYNKNKGEVILKPNYEYSDAQVGVRGYRIRFNNGYGDNASDVPNLLKTALKLTVAHWFENRESQDIPNEAKRLLQQYKVYNIGLG